MYEKLKSMREEKGLSVSEVSSITDIPNDRLINIEAGICEPTRKELKQLCACYTMPVFADLAISDTTYEQIMHQPGCINIMECYPERIINLLQIRKEAKNADDKQELYKDYTKAVRKILGDTAT